MKVNLNPAALAALEADGAVKFDRPLPTKIIQLIRRQFAETLFGPTLRPTFKTQLLMFSSFAAIKSGWATNHFERMARERTRN